MSGLMKLCGAVLAILGLVLALARMKMPGQLDVLSITMDSAVSLFVGGILALGLGGVIDAMRGRSVAATPAAAVPAPSATQALAPAAGAKSAATGVAVAAGAGLGAIAASAKSSDPVAETIKALDKAKADVAKSMSGMDDLGKAPAPSPAKVAEKPVEDEPPAEEEDDLFVLEEKIIRGRAARILSDETVEAETDEGWMRFENLEHLNEYLDSVEEQKA